MKVLLDASFLRHLELVNGIELICILTNNVGWKFIIPQIVLDELNQKYVHKSIKNFMRNEIIHLDYCTKEEFTLTKQIGLGLDDGELEAICIVNKCEDRQFKEYLILTDDFPAQKKSSKLGINTLDVVSFLFFSNQKGALSADLASKSLEILQNNGYHIDHSVRRDFMKRLV